MHNPISILLFTVLVSSALAGCEERIQASRDWTPEDHGQPEVSDPARVPSAPKGEAETTANAARALWNVSCASCHGRDGGGRGPAAPPGAAIPDMRTATFQSARTDAQIADVIRQGRGLMPPFGKQINEDGIAALIRYVRTMKDAAE
jgi:mono/diheme cytochrome c family protein